MTDDGSRSRAKPPSWLWHRIEHLFGWQATFIVSEIVEERFQGHDLLRIRIGRRCLECGQTEWGTPEPLEKP